MRDFVVLKSTYTISLALFFPNTINTPLLIKKKRVIIYRGKKSQEIILCMTLRTERYAGRQTRRILSSPQLKNKDLTGSLHFSSGATSGLLADLWSTILGSQPLN